MRDSYGLALASLGVEGLFGADHVPLRIQELDQETHGRNLAFRHDDLAALFDYGRRCRVDIGDQDGALVAKRRLAIYQGMSLLQAAVDAWIVRSSRRDQ